MKVRKRDGVVKDFDFSKITNAVKNCYQDVFKGTKEFTKDYPLIEGLVKQKLETIEDEVIDIERIQDIVVGSLNSVCQVVSKSYSDYRAKRTKERNANSNLFKNIETLVDYSNEDVMRENSNKNSYLNSTQRDLIAGEISKEVAKTKLIPDYIVEAHENGVLHWHDMDYTISSMFNCFSGDTKLVTDKGIFSFEQCGEDSVVNVLDKDGIWRSAIVRKYGKQKINKVILKSCGTKKEVMVTNNHRWLLKDGSITTNLKIGDKLYLLNNIQEEKDIDLEMFCFGFVLGDGTEYNYSDTNKGLRIRLCGNKVEHIDKFKEAGYTISTYKDSKSSDIWVTKATSLSKKFFIDNKEWRNLNHKQLYSLFKGYYEADGFKDRNGIATSNSKMAEMIREISCVCGYHITSEKFEIRNTNYKNNAELYTFGFMISQPTNRNWKVEEIIELDKLEDVWCVEEPMTKTFTLSGGVVTGNCCLINLEDMLDNGTVINEKLVETPKSFSTACTVTTQIIAQVASNQYGGNSITIRHLAKYLRRSYDKAFKHFTEDKKFSKEVAEDLAQDFKMKELKDGIQTIRYQLSTLQTTNGQAPFGTIYLEIVEGDEYEEEMALICEEMIRQRLEGMKNYKGQEIGEAFPKLVYLLDKHNCLEGGKYDYITKLCAKCSAKRLVPDYQSAKIMRENYEGNAFPPMGCRSHLSTWKDENGNYKWYGRFNQGVVSINLPQIGIIAKGDMDLFWKMFDERLELCKEALLVRHELLEGTKSDVSPIHWQHGAIARLKQGETIDELLHNGYSTISLGYVGLYELTQAILGVTHTNPVGEKFALEVMNYMKKKCEDWKKETGLGFGLYGKIDCRG